MSLIKNLVERINVQHNKNYCIDRTKTKKPIQLQRKKIEQRKYELKKTLSMKIDSTAVSKTIKDGQKAGTHKCMFLYTEQEWPAGAEKAKAKKSAKKGQVLFKDDYSILTGQEDPKLFCKWVFFLEERFLKDPNDYSKVD